MATMPDILGLRAFWDDADHMKLRCEACDWEAPLEGETQANANPIVLFREHYARRHVK